MTESKVSVVVACYNVEKELERCLQSIVQQTYRNLEIILVDDGSTDETSAICDRFGAADRRIVVVHQQNKGLSAARNAGIQVATAEYITFVDGDDFLHEKYVATLVAIARETSAEIAVTSYMPYFEGNPVPQVDDTLNKNAIKEYSPLKAIETMFYQSEFETSAWGKLYKTSLFDDIGYPTGWIYEDLATTYKLMLKAEKTAFVPITTYFYLIRSNSIEGSRFSMEKFESYCKICDQLISDERLFPIAKAVKSRVFSFSMRTYFMIQHDCEQKDIVWRRIKSLRMGVILDSRVRMKSRVAALLSLGGSGLAKVLYRKIKVR